MFKKNLIFAAIFISFSGGINAIESDLTAQEPKAQMYSGEHISGFLHILETARNEPNLLASQAMIEVFQPFEDQLKHYSEMKELSEADFIQIREIYDTMGQRVDKYREFIQNEFLKSELLENECDEREFISDE